MLSIGEIRNNCFESTYFRGRDYFQQHKVESFFVDSVFLDDELCTEITASVSGTRNRTYNVTILLNEKDRIEDFDCDCEASYVYWGMCKHCVAVALTYRLDSTETETDILTLSTKAPKIQETSHGLKTLMDQYAQLRNTDPLRELQGTVQLECSFSQYNDRFLMECKIGTNRMYVVKNLVKLVYDVRNENYVEYGVNLKFTHRLSAFTESSRQLYQLIERVILNLVPQYDYPAYHSGNNYRYVPLYHENLEDILMFFQGQRIPFESGSVHVAPGNPPVTLQFKEQNGGALLTLPDLHLFQGRNRIFLMDGSTIWCCTPEFSRAMAPLFSLQKSVDFRTRTPTTYLSQKDYTAFCRDILPVIRPFVTLETGSLDLAKYAPIEPEFSLYLRMPDRETLELTGSVRYREQSFDLLKSTGTMESFRNREAEQELTNLLEQYFAPTIRSTSAATALSALSQTTAPEQPSTPQFLTDHCCWAAEGSDAIYQVVFEGLDKFSQKAQLYVDDTIRRIMHGATPTVSVGIGYSGNLLDLDIQVGGMEPEEIQAVLSAYRLKKKYYRLKSGDFMFTDQSPIETLAELSDGLGIKDKELASGQFQRESYRAMYLDNVLSSSQETKIRKNQGFRQLVDNIQDFSTGDTPLPQGLNAQLRSYQQEGYQWLSTLYRYGFGGILADDMGLGKTLQLITLMLRQKETSEKFSALVVCPASLIYNWEREIQKFAPDLTTQVIAGSKSERTAQIQTAPQFHVSITSYDLLKRNIGDYENSTFDLCILDEAQYIKNAGTQVAKAVKSIQTGHRFALTGTPIENRLSDLWSIFDFLMPGYLYTYQKFKSELESPIIKSDDPQATERLSRMVTPFLLRRKKEDVLKDLPEKLEETIFVSMVPEQEKLYRAHLGRMQKEYQNKDAQAIKKSQIQILAEITRLRQLCCAPELCYENYTGGSGKVDAILELLENAVDAGHRVLVFSQFTALLELLIQRWGSRGHLYLSGKDSKLRRREMVDAFQTGTVPVFFISLKAGGTGLNLTEADTVIHCDPWWNVAAQNQATDRAHRIGQDKVVNVMKIVAKDTIEERILTLQEKKSTLSDTIIEGEGVGDFHLDRETLNELFR